MPSGNSAALVLPDEVKEMVNGALAAGTPILLAAVDAAGRPLLSFRGSTQVFSDDQLCLWIRNVLGETIEAIRARPGVALMYRSETTPFLRFEGHARVTENPDERERVFASAPEREQQADPSKSGHAVVIDLDNVEGVLRFTADGPVFCRLSRTEA